MAEYNREDLCFKYKCEALTQNDKSAALMLDILYLVQHAGKTHKTNLKLVLTLAFVS